MIRKIAVALCLLGLFTSSFAENKPPLTLIIHGGAGYFDKLSTSKKQQYKHALNQALDNGYQVLKRGGKSIDAVTAAITSMENSGVFDAGKGARLTTSGDVSLDASIMQGSTMKAGAVIAQSTLKNPIQVAKAVMMDSHNVLMVGPSVVSFAKQHHLNLVPRSYFKSPSKITKPTLTRNHTVLLVQ